MLKILVRGTIVALAISFMPYNISEVQSVSITQGGATCTGMSNTLRCQPLAICGQITYSECPSTSLESNKTCIASSTSETACNTVKSCNSITYFPRQSGCTSTGEQ
jgi:hypothetical protein